MRCGQRAKDTAQRRGASLCLGLARVLAAVLAVDALEVPAAGPDVLERALGDVRARVVVLLAELEGVNAREYMRAYSHRFARLRA